MSIYIKKQDYMLINEINQNTVPNKKNNISKYLLYCLICIFTFLNSTGILIISEWFFVITVTFLLLFSDDIQAFSFLLGLQLLDDVILITIGSSIVSFLFILLPLAIIKKIYKRNENIFSAYSIAILLTLICFEIINLLSYEKSGLGTVVIWIFSMVYYYIIVTDGKFRVNVFEALLLMFISFITLCFINMQAATNAGYNGYDILFYNTFYRFGDQFRALGGPNTMAYIASQIIGLSLICFFIVKSRPKKILCLLMTVFALVFGLITLSRALIVEILIIACCFIMDKRKISFFQKFIIAFLGLLAIILLLCYTSLGQQIIGFFTDRFESEGNRIDLLAKALDCIFKNFKNAFLGSGIIYQYVPGNDFTAHNIYLDAFVAFGVIGGMLYWLFHFMNYKIISLRKRGKRTMLFFIPLIILLSYGIIIGSVRDVGYYFNLTLAFFIANNLTVSNEK